MTITLVQVSQYGRDRVQERSRNLFRHLLQYCAFGDKYNMVKLHFLVLQDPTWNVVEDKNISFCDPST